MTLSLSDIKTFNKASVNRTAVSAAIDTSMKQEKIHTWVWMGISYMVEVAF